MNNSVIGAFAGNEPIASNIMMIGVGGAGCNVVEDMYRLGIHNVSFMVCNTDTLALNKKSIPLRITLGAELTKGLGAGADPSVGRDAAVESEELIRKTLQESGTKMAFITAGMGGGTGTGAAPVIARICQEMNILTVGFVTVPQKTEGPRRMRIAMEGLHEIVKYLDSILIVDNQMVVETHGNLRTLEQFKKANNILAESAKGVAEIITVELTVNVDFADVRTTMRKSGITLLGTSIFKIKENEDYVDKTMATVLNSSLLIQNDITGAKNILVNISWGGTEPFGNEIDRILQIVQEEAGGNNEANIIYGMGQDYNLAEDEMKITVVATAFDSSKDRFGLYDKNFGCGDVPLESTTAIAQAPATNPPKHISVPNSVIKEGVFSKSSSKSRDVQQRTQALNIGRCFDDKVKIRQENIEYLKSIPLNEIESTPAYRRYKIDVGHVSDQTKKHIVKLEE